MSIYSPSTASLSNPYKFRVYLATAQNTTAGTSKINYDTKTYDTGSNVDIVTNKGRFTAPIAGFYSFTATAQTISTTNLQVSLFKNSSAVSQGVNASGSGVNQGSIVSDTLQLAAGDFIEVDITAAAVVAIFTGSVSTYFSGFLVSVN